MTATPETITPEMRETCLWAHDELLRRQAKIDELQTDILRLQLSLSCILPIAELSTAETDRHTCMWIRRSLGLPPLAGRPVLAVDNTRSAT